MPRTKTEFIKYRKKKKKKKKILAVVFLNLMYFLTVLKVPIPSSAKIFINARYQLQIKIKKEKKSHP